ncbi:hypothetical protein SacglDRAFT_02412 [Saccharomonospora glauca K62]|uniref:Uncharacterized protein n=1 Tax=Saccharomonospora glauca K62 TaxID=928724 RepID=I1D2Y1_9PSEU|nr:hypothetical protein SacglDRAFT_02412 [Saccharomonospora glauca K62]
MTTPNTVRVLVPEPRVPGHSTAASPAREAIK